MKKLAVSKEFEVRFSEVDSMNVVWHGAYPLYLEDAREKFGAKYGLEYLTIFNNGYFAPLVDMQIKYHKPLRYGSHPRIDIFMCLSRLPRLSLIMKYTTRSMTLLWPQHAPSRCLWIAIISLYGTIHPFISSGRSVWV